MAQDQKPVEQQEYKGVGGFGNAVNEAVTWGSVAAVAGTTWNHKSLGAEAKKLAGEDVAKLNGILGSIGTGKEVPAELVPTLEKFAKRNKYITGAAVATAAVAGYLGYSKGAEGEQQFKDAQSQVTALRGQKAEIAAERDQAVGQLSHAAKILQERAAAVAPKSMDTAPVTASAGASSHAVPHAPLHGHAAALAEKGHEHHVNHADHATASKEHAAHAGHSV